MNRPDKRPRQDAPGSYLPDGTALFGRLGVLAVDADTGLVQCAACGRWLRTVGGSHLHAAHGLTAESYRERFGLLLRRALEAPDRRAARGASTRERVAREPRLAAMLERGAAAARSGELAAGNRGKLGERSRRSAERPERQQLLALSSRRGAQANQAAADERLAVRARALGFAGLPDYLRARHAAGWSVSRTSADLEVAREKVARLLAELGLPGMLDPAHPVEVAALRRVDASDLETYLHRQHDAGAPVAVSARALGHSTTWLMIRARRNGLERLVAAGPTAEQRATAAARQAGFSDAASWLVHRRSRGEGSRALQTDTGLSPQRLAQLLRAGGVASPTVAHERRVLAGAGFEDLPAYTRARAGWTVLRMSRELGVSDLWLARQLRAHDLGHLIGPKGRNSLARAPGGKGGRPGQDLDAERGSTVRLDPGAAAADSTPMTLSAGPAGPHATIRPAPAWRSLMTVLRDAGSPPRRLLAECFPHDAVVRKAYRTSPAEPPVPSAGAPRTMGSAFDVWLQLQTAPRPVMGAASAGARRCGPAVQAAYGLLLERLGPAEPAGAAPGGPRPAALQQWTGPSAGLTEADLARLCWVAALLVEAYRAGMLAAGSPLAQLPSQPAPEQLLELAPATAVDELLQLAALARTQLLPALHQRTNRGPTWPGVQLPGSAMMPADVDLITGRTLLEVKVEQGSQTAAGRRLYLTGELLWQLLGYVLHDLDDHYRLQAVGVYQARYGRLVLWSLPELLEDLAGRPVDLPEVRARWRRMLVDEQPAGLPPAGAGRPRPP